MMKTIEIDEQALKALEDFCKRRGLTPSEAIKRLVEIADTIDKLINFFLDKRVATPKKHPKAEKPRAKSLNLPEVRRGNYCPKCSAGFEVLYAFETNGYIHRLLVKCTRCGRQYIKPLYQPEPKTQFNLIKRYHPNAKLMSWRDFKSKAINTGGQ